MAFDGRRLQYDFWSAQRDALSALEGGEYDIVAFLAGYRSGKTVTGARWVISKALRLCGTRWLAMGQDFEKAKSTTYRVLFEQLPGERTHILTSSHNGPEQSPIVEDYNRNDRRLTLTNDSVIQLGSADKWSRYAGDEFSGIWLDEPSHYGEELYDLREVMGTRLSADRGPRCMFWSLTGNGYNSAWKILEEREDNGGDPINDRIEVIRASVLDNPFLDESVKERFRRQFEGTGREQQALHGGFAAEQGLVYDIQRGVHVVARERFGDDLPPIEDDSRVYGYDAGFKDPRVVLELGRTVGDQDLVVLDEFYSSKTQVEAAIAWLQDDGRPEGVIAAEHEPTDIQRMRKAGLDPREAIKGLDAGLSEVNGRFNPEDTDEPRLYVAEHCANTVRELYSYKEEDIGGTDTEDHAMDALRYAVMAVAEGQDTANNVRHHGSMRDIL
jgi:hypothetical protein